MRKSVVVAAGTALVLAACADGTGPDSAGLSRAEALSVAAFVAASSEGAAGTSMTATGPDMQNPPVEFEHTHESTHPCPAGGDVTVAFTLSGVVDESTQSLQADLSGSHVHNACGVPHRGRTLVLTGAPAIGFTASMAAANGLPTQPFTHSVDGAFEWAASDGRAGTCTIDFSAVTDFIQKNRTVQGSICGHTFTTTTTWN